MYVVKEKFHNAFKQRMPVSRNFVETEIFKNPTSKELSECGSECRGYISPKGDVFVAIGSTTKNSMIHADLLVLLGKEVPSQMTKSDGGFVNFISDPLKYGVCIQRIKKTNSFMLAESYLQEEIDSVLNDLTKLFIKADMYNPSLKFEPRTTTYFDFAKK